MLDLKAMIINEQYSARSLSQYKPDEVIDTIVSMNQRNDTTISMLKYCARQGSYRVDVVGKKIYVDGSRFI